MINVNICLNEDNESCNCNIHVSQDSLDQALNEFTTLFTVLYREVPEKVLAEALYTSEWGQRINEVAED